MVGAVDMIFLYVGYLIFLPKFRGVLNGSFRTPMQKKGINKPWNATKDL